MDVYRIVQSAEAQAVVERYETLMALLAEFDMRLFTEWASCVPSQIARNLKRSLLTRAKNNNDLLLNFHNQVSLATQTYSLVFLCILYSTN